MAKILPQLNHVGIYVSDMDRMVAFYTRVLNMAVTDAGVAASVGTHCTFLSSDPEAHHQLVLITWPTGRERGAGNVNQLSFKVATLSELRGLCDRVDKAGVAPMKPLNHGNALSVYTHDPEDNGVELYMDLPWYVSQPFGEPLDLRQSDAQILEATERRVRLEPSFQPRARWAERVQRVLSEPEAG